MNDSYFHDLYVFGLALTIIVRAYYALKSKRKEVKEKLPTLFVEKVLMIGWGLSQLAACLFVFTDWFKMSNYTMPVWLSYHNAPLFIRSA